MAVNWKKVVGVTTIVGILGLTTYAIISHRREKKLKEMEISAEEAKEIVEDEVYKGEVIGRKPKYDIPLDYSDVTTSKEYNNIKTQEEVENEVFEKLKETENRITSKSIKKEVEDMVEYSTAPDMILSPLATTEDWKSKMEELGELNDISSEPHIDEGEGILRYDPNSEEALKQYISMELAEWSIMEKSRETLDFLFTVDFEPSKSDLYLNSKLMDYRSEFFGQTSGWVKNISFADVILHFARMSDFHLGGGVRKWADHFMRINSMDINIYDEEDLVYMTGLMDEHDYFIRVGEEHRHSLFGLSEKYNNNAIARAEESIHGALNYEIEFEEFLKQEMNGGS